MKNTITLPQQSQFLMVNQKRKISISTQSIVMLEGFVNYTLIHLEDGTQKLYARTLSHFQKLLINDHFIRVHQSYLVNPMFILNYDEKGNRLFMENNLEANISRRKKKNLSALIC